MSEKPTTETPQSDKYPLEIRPIIQLLLVGAATGALGWLLYLLTTKYFIYPVFCASPETFAICKNGGTIAWIIAHLVALTASVAVLARFSVYRPLLIVIATLIALWGSHSWLGGMEWYIGLLWSTILFALAIAAFGWLARSVNFLVALVGSLLVIVAVRLVLILS